MFKSNPFHRRFLRPSSEFTHTHVVDVPLPEVEFVSLDEYIEDEGRLAEPYKELTQVQEEQIDLLMGMIEQQATIINAARHLIDVMHQRQASGPVFKLAEEGDDPASVQLIRHAVLDLVSKLDGMEAPELCLPERTH